MNPKVRARWNQVGNLPANRGYVDHSMTREDQQFFELAFDAAWFRFILDDPFVAWYQRHSDEIRRLDNTVWFEDRKALLVRKSPGGRGVNLYLPVRQWPRDRSVTYLLDAAVLRFFNKVADVLDVQLPPRPTLPE